MTKNVIQIRMPEKLADAIQGLVKKGLYKNRSEVIATLRARRSF
jgi:Arc/MetJ-type ribon-helix-helix transcriptional regulator